LGWDFQKARDCNLAARSGILTFQSEHDAKYYSVPTHRTVENTLNTIRCLGTTLRITHTMTLKPLHEARVEAECSNAADISTKPIVFGFVEQANNTKAMVPKSFGWLQRGKVLMKIANPHDRSILIPKNTVIARFNEDDEADWHVRHVDLDPESTDEYWDKFDERTGTAVPISAALFAEADSYGEETSRTASSNQPPSTVGTSTQVSEEVTAMIASFWPPPIITPTDTKVSKQAGAENAHLDVPPSAMIYSSQAKTRAIADNASSNQPLLRTNGTQVAGQAVYSNQPLCDRVPTVTKLQNRLSLPINLYCKL
jgi:hypothetical protein